MKLSYLKLTLIPLLILLGIRSSVQGQQNLMVNGSFENYTNCPHFGGTWSSSNPSIVPGWTKVTNQLGSVDMYGPCDPYQGPNWPHNNYWGTEDAQEGVVYAGLYITKVDNLVNWREYLVGSFTTPLTAGETYELSFYVSLADTCKYGTDGFHWYFSNSVPSISTAGMTTSQLHRELEFHGIYPSVEYTGPAIMQKNGWALVSGQYTAIGGETNVTIGNFKTTANSAVVTSPTGTRGHAYYYIDNVSLMKVVTPVNVTISNDSLMVENCSSLPIQLIRTGNLEDTLSAIIGYGGTAIEGTDFTTSISSGSINFLPNQDTITLWLEAINDQLQELPYETVYLTIEYLDNEGNIIQDTSSTIQIIDPLSLELSTSVICMGDTVFLTGTGGILPYDWSSNPSVTQTSDTTAFAIITTNTTFVLNSSATGCADTDSTDIQCHPLPALIANDAFVCYGDSILLSAQGADMFLWTPFNGLNTTEGPNVVCTTLDPVTYTIQGKDTLTGCINSLDIHVSVEQVQLSIDTGFVLCANDVNDIAEITISGTNQYIWSPANGLNTSTGASVTARPDTTTTYQVIGTSLNGCSDTIYTTVEIIPLFEIHVSADTICQGDTAKLVASGAENYVWESSANIDYISEGIIHTAPQSSTTYSVNGFINGCLAQEETYVSVIPNPIANGEYKLINNYLPEPSITLISDNWESIYWYYENSLISQSHEFTQLLNEYAGLHLIELIVINDFGCMDSLELAIEIKNPQWIYVPNAFTPNGDGYNNVFTPILGGSIDLNNYSFQIYNRWGELLLESFDPSQGWDGTYKGQPVESGVYTWKIRVNSVYNASAEIYSGHVVLIR